MTETKGGSTPTGGGGSCAGTPPYGPSPEQVLAVFRRTGKRRRVGPPQVTPEIRALADLFGPGVLASHAKRLTKSGQAYLGFHLLAEALTGRLPEMEAAIAAPPTPSDPAAQHDEYRKLRHDCRLLKRLLRSLADAEPTLFFQQGQFAVIRQGVADASGKSTGIALVYAGVTLVLEQSGDVVGVSSSSIACRVTAALLTCFAHWGVVTDDMVSAEVREQIKQRDKPWRDRWVWKKP